MSTENAVGSGVKPTTQPQSTVGHPLLVLPEKAISYLSASRLNSPGADDTIIRTPGAPARAVEAIRSSARRLNAPNNNKYFPENAPGARVVGVDTDNYVPGLHRITSISARACVGQVKGSGNGYYG